MLLLRLGDRVLKVEVQVVAVARLGTPDEARVVDGHRQARPSYSSRHVSPSLRSHPLMCDSLAAALVWSRAWQASAHSNTLDPMAARGASIVSPSATARAPAKASIAALAQAVSWTDGVNPRFRASTWWGLMHSAPQNPARRPSTAASRVSS